MIHAIRTDTRLRAVRPRAMRAALDVSLGLAVSAAVLAAAQDFDLTMGVRPAPNSL